MRVAKFAVVIHTEDGGRGEYVAQWVANRSTLGQALMLAPRLLYKDARERIAIYDDLKREMRQWTTWGMARSTSRCGTWRARSYGASVGELLGGYRKRLPAYASTYHGDRTGASHSKEAFAAFAQEC